MKTLDMYISNLSDHHDGCLHVSCSSRPRTPYVVLAISSFTFLVQTVQVGMITSAVPPGTFEMCCTMTAPYIIVPIRGGEHPVVVIS